MRFWRRRRRAPELGAAVTALPSGPVRSEVPPRPRDAAPDVPPAPGPRVELVFRDGTSAHLDPSSEQARALEDVARALMAPDPLSP